MLTSVTIGLLKGKLKLFLEEDEVEEVWNKIIASTELAKKNSYSKEESEKLFEAMIREGGFVEFVARSIRASLLLN